MPETSIYMQLAGGSVEQFGAGLARGITPESPLLNYDEHGCADATFTLRRAPFVQWPDIVAGTRVWVIQDGLVTWQGRVSETPSVSGAGEERIDVVCEGWSAHFSDDAIQRTYVQTDIAAWRDARTLPATPFATWTSSAAVTTGAGAITINAVNGSAQSASIFQGVVLDMGPEPSNKAARVVLTYDHSATPAANANWSITIRVTDSSDLTGGVSTSTTFPAGASPLSISYTPATAGRYVAVSASRTGGAATLTTDVWLRLLTTQVFTATAYESGGASVLKASDVIKDVLSWAPLVSQDTSLVQTPGAFTIPHMVGARDAPRAYIDAANAYHLWQWKLDCGDGAGGKPRLVYRPIPTRPTLIAPVGDGVSFADASRNALAELYSAVTVEYTDYQGQPAAVSRVASDSALPPVWVSSAVAVSNPTFEGDTVGLAPAGWLSVAGTLVTVAGGDASSAKAMQVTASAGGIVNPTPSVAPVAIAGKRYRVMWRIQRLAGWTTGNLAPNVTCTTSSGVVVSSVSATPIAPASFTVGQWTTVNVDVTVPQGGTTLNLNLGSGISAYNASTALYLVDNVTVYESAPTLIDRQGFTRRRVLTTNARLTSAAAAQLGDAYLGVHAITPLRGTLQVQGAAIDDALTGRPVPASQLGCRVGDAIALGGTEVDPVSGAIGRVGVIARVNYDADADQATVELQNSLDFIDAILARFGAYQS